MSAMLTDNFTINEAKERNFCPRRQVFRFGLSSSGSDLSRARPGETAVLLPVLPATAVPPLQTAPDSLWTQNPPGGAGVPGSESTTVLLPNSQTIC